MSLLSNASTPVNLLIAQNADFGPVLLNFANSDGTPINLTGCILAAAIRKTYRTDVLAQFVLQVTDAVNGVATITLDAAATASLAAGVTPIDPAGAYVWDLKLLDANGRISRPMAGGVQIMADVTP